MDQAAVLARRFGEPAQVARVVLGRKEHRATVIAALDHVERLIGQKIAAEPRASRQAMATAILGPAAGKIYSDQLEWTPSTGGCSSRL